MAAKFQDYYGTLGVPRTASAEQVQSAYRTLARKYHPDVNKTPEGERRFKEVNEAYEVLKDPKKRALYDRLGPDWKAGERTERASNGRARAGRRAGGSAESGGTKWAGETDGPVDFSDFFESVFGSMPGGGAAGRGGGRGSGRGGRGRRTERSGKTAGVRGVHGDQPAEFDAELSITIDDVFSGRTCRITVGKEDDPGERRTIDVRVPRGAVDGTVIRLAGQGLPDEFGERGDLRLRLRLERDSRYRPADRPAGAVSADPHDLLTVLAVAPWEAALGAKVPVETPGGRVTLTIPAGTPSGQRLRIKGRGLPRRSGEAGDLYAEVKIVVPKDLSREQRELFERLGAASANFPERGA